MPSPARRSGKYASSKGSGEPTVASGARTHGGGTPFPQPHPALPSTMSLLGRPGILWIAVTVELGLLVAAAVLMWLFGVSPARGLRLGAWPFLQGIAATVPLVVLMWWSLQTPWQPIAGLREDVLRDVAPMFAGCRVIDVAIIAVTAGVAEEVLFRGVLQNAVSELSTPALGLIVASVVFGLAHFVSPLYAALAGLIGAYLGTLWLSTGNLFVPIVVHAAYDFVALLAVLREARTR